MDDTEFETRRNLYLLGLLDGIAEHGHMLQGVFPTEDDPEDTSQFCYTVGLARHGKPELIMFGLPFNGMGVILNDLAERENLQAGQVLDDAIAGGYVVKLVQVEDSSEHLTAANALYRDDGEPPVPALQVVWPDDEHRFPWDDGYKYPAHVQPVLGLPS